MFFVKLFDNYLKADFIINEKTVLSKMDRLNDIENLGTFTREIKSHKYEFIEN